MLRLAAVLLVVCAAIAAPPPYDLLLKGGHVIDPKNGVDGVRDVAITDGRIARVAEDIPAAEARRVLHVDSLYVTPGLVDIHTHLFAGTGSHEAGGGDMSLPPDGFTFRSGVTTAVDAGSSGWRTFPDFKQRIIDSAQTRVLAFLNIVGRGMVGRETLEQDTSDMDPRRTADMVYVRVSLTFGFLRYVFKLVRIDVFQSAIYPLRSIFWMSAPIEVRDPLH